MIGRLAALIEALGTAPAVTRLLTFIAVAPRQSHVGYLDAIGASLERILLALQAPNVLVYRVMHAQGAILTTPSADFEKRIELLCKEEATPELEVRALLVSFDGPRTAGWLDEILDEMADRKNTGSFSSAHCRRLVDGSWSTHQ